MSRAQLLIETDERAPGIFEDEQSGSAGRIRTYNPPVNSRTLYR